MEAAESLDVMAEDDAQQAWVERQLADAPDLTPEQVARVRRVLASAVTERERREAERQVRALRDDR